MAFATIRTAGFKFNRVPMISFIFPPLPPIKAWVFLSAALMMYFEYN
jgi:hypothetical protein